MQVGRPKQYDPVYQEECLQKRVEEILYQEEQCVTGIVQAQKRRSYRWPIIILVNILLVGAFERENLMLLGKKAMITT